MLELHNGGEPVDALTLVEHLKQAGQLEAAGGRATIDLLAASVPAVGHLRQYARIVRENAMLRRLLRAAYEIQARVHCARRAAARARRHRRAHDPRGRPRGQPQGLPRDPRRPRHRDRQAREALARGQVDHRHAVRLRGPRHDHGRLPARQPDHPGRAAVDGEVGADGELRRERRARREQGRRAVLARDVGVRARAALHRVAGLDQGRRPAQGQACPRRAGARSWRRSNRLAKSPLFIDDSSDLSVLDVRAKARRLLQQHADGLGLILIDYLQLMRADGRTDNRVEQIGQISRGPQDARARARGAR